MSNQISLEELKQIVYKYFEKNNFLKMFLSDREIKNRLDKNIINLFLGDKNRSVLGSYDCTKKTINLFLGENVEKDELLSEKNIETIIHEAVHALFRHRYGTGMFFIKPIIDEGLQRIFNPKADFPEIGRGLNEGFTNWVVQQSGLETNSYINLTEIISIIYACIGAEKMIPFASCNYKKICNSLHMSRDFGIEFIRQADELSFSERKLGKINDILAYFTGMQKVFQTRNKEEYKELLKNYGNLAKLDIFSDIIEPEEQEKMIQVLLGEDLPNESTIEEISKFIYDKIEMIEERWKKPEVLRKKYLVSSVIDKLSQSLILNRLDEPETIEDYEKLAEILDSIRFLIKENEIEEVPESCIEIGTKINTISNEALRSILDATREETKNGTISSSFFEQELKKLITLYSLDGRPETLENGISSFINLITENSNLPQEQKILIKYAISNNRVKDLPHLSIRTTKSGKSIILNGSLMIGVIDKRKDDFVQYKKSFRLEKGENYKDKADWTISMDTDISSLARQFEKLKNKKMKENPDTKIYILEGIVAFQTKDGYQFYEVTEGKDAGIIPAKFNTDKFIESMIEERRPLIQENLLPVKPKFGIFSGLRRKINAIKFYIDSKKYEKEDTDKDEDRGIIITGSSNKKKENLQENLRQDYLNHKRKKAKTQDKQNSDYDIEIDREDIDR